MAPFDQPGIGYSITSKTTLPVVAFKDVPSQLNMNGERVHYYDQLGLNNFQLLQGTIRAFGLDQLMLPYHMAQNGIDWLARVTPMESYVGYRAVGRDVNQIAYVVSCASPDGYGLGTLQLVIAAEGGNALRFLNQGQQIETESGEAFLITGETVNADGFQQITLVPARPDQQIIVENGQSRDAPNGTFLGTFATGELGEGNPDECEQEYNQYIVQPDLIKTCSMTRMVMYHDVYKKDLQNNIAGGDFAMFYLNMYGVDMPGMPRDFSIAGYMKNWGRQEKIRFFSQVGAYMLYGREVEGQNGVLMGNGIVENIAPQNVIRYSASKQLTKSFFENVLNNTYALLNRGYGNSPENPLLMLCGSAAYAAIMANLQEGNAVEFREDPYRMNLSGQGMERRGGYLSTNRIYSDLATILGVYVRIVRFTPMDGRYYNARRHPENVNLGITSGDIIILPVGATAPAVNIDDPTLAPMQAQGPDMVNFYSAKDNATGGADFMTTQYREEGLRMDGSTAQGEVVEFGGRLRTKHIISFAAELADPLAGLYITLK